MNVEIIGYSCIAPGADGPAELFRLLKDGRCTVTTVPRDRWDQSRYWHPVAGTPGKTYSFAAGVIGDVYAFDPGVFGMSRREASALDPQQRLALMLAWRALEDANIDPDALRGTGVGVFIGASSLDHANLVVEDPPSGSPYFMSGNTLSVVSNRISHIFDLSGPSMTIDTACSSSLVALDQAFKAMEAGSIDTAIVGGVNILSNPFPFVGFSQAKMLSPEGLCRAYDDRGAGYVRAEGGAVFVLRRADVARERGDRSHATIVASETNAAGRTNGISLPSPEAQAELLSKIYGPVVDPTRLAFIEGHGTGTRVGDPSEVWSIGTVVGKRRSAPIVIGSIKTNIGHTEPASGAFGLLKAILALENNLLPPSLHFEVPHREIDFDGLNVRVATTGLKLLSSGKLRYAGVNSFGFGGTNAHVVITDPPIYVKDGKEAAKAKIFLATAHSEQALRGLLMDYAQRMVEPNAENVVHTTGTGRARQDQRFVVANPTVSRVRGSIAAYLAGEKSDQFRTGQAIVDDGEIAFAFSGNGSQWAGMGIDAHRTDRQFRNRYDEIAALFRLYSDDDCSKLLFSGDLGERLADTRVAQTLLFAIQAAMADGLRLRGIRPSAVFGHSVGEIAAAYVAGALTLADAVRVIAVRARHQHNTAGMGRMAAAAVSTEAAEALIAKEGLSNVHVAAHNSRESVTVTGPASEIETFVKIVRSTQRAVTLLDIDYPFHHPMIDREKDGFLRDLPDLSPNPTKLPFISSVTGTVLDGTALGADYWWRNLREPVMFAKAATHTLALGYPVLLEIGPRPILQNYLVDAVRAEGRGVALASLAKTKPGATYSPLDSIACSVIANGGAFDREQIFAPRQARVTHPRLPFDPLSLRLEKTNDAVSLYGRDSAPSRLCGWRVDPNGSAWKNHIDAHLLPDFAEHVVDGKSILPATGFLEIAVGAAQEYFQCSDVEIVNLEIVRALELKLDVVTELSTILSPETGDIEIRSRPRLDDSGWTLHVKARCKPISTSARSLPSARPNPSADRVITASRTYEVASSFGLQYGPRFQLLEEARLSGDNRISVRLSAAGDFENGYLACAIDPRSADACLHGLVALFEEFSDAADDTPYVPVRIGKARIFGSGQPIVGAEIELHSASEHSIRATIWMMGEGNETIACLSDVRFRRAALRQRPALEALSFHYDVVPYPLVPVEAEFRSKNHAIVAEWIGGLSEADADGVSLLLGAAAYRTAFDIAHSLADTTMTVLSSRLSSGSSLAKFRRLCLQHLVDADLAAKVDGGWKLAEAHSLPPFDDLVELILGDDSRRAVEIVALNDARRWAQAGAEEHSGSILAEATADHLATGSVPALLGLETLWDLFYRVTANTTSPVVVELGYVSASFSRDMANRVRALGGRYYLIEDQESVREIAAYQLGTLGYVDIVGSDGLPGDLLADVVVSGSNELYSRLLEVPAARSGLRRLLVRGALLVAVFEAPGVLSDLTRGQIEDWLGEDGEGRVFGRLAGAKDWRSILDDIGVKTIELRQVNTGQVDLIALGAVGTDAGFLSVDEATQVPDLLWLNTDKVGRASRKAATSFDLSAAVAHGSSKLAWVYDGGCVSGLDAPNHVQRCIKDLSALAREMSAIAPSQPEISRPALIVLLDGGAPVTRASAKQRTIPVSTASAGLWAFLRTARNEFPDLRILSIDAAGQDRKNPYFLSSVGRCLGAVGRDEWLLSAPAGHRVHELRAVPGARPTSEIFTQSFDAATLAQDANTSISTLRWIEQARPEPRAGEVLIEVAATGLNFRDVMWAMSLLPEEALEDGFAGATIGMECTGTVVAVAPDVSAFQIGDRVMAFASSAFSTHVAVSAKAVAKLPENVSMIAGATVPVAFLTAHYALVELARLRAGQTILIHGGAGGVGLAAIQIARNLGARVFGTAGSEEKRAFLSLSGVEAVFDSRSLEFVEAVRSATDGQGVDVVLNSLFGEAMEQSIGLVRPFGRFLELGKRDYYSDRKIGLRPFRRNISYFGIDADQLLLADAGLAQAMMADLSSQFAEGKLSPLPVRMFPADDIRSVFRLMQGSGHIGKIVVTPPVSGRQMVRRAASKPRSIDSDGVHALFGGLGGFGLVTAGWLIAKGARMVALCSRSGVADAAAQEQIDRWTRSGIKIEVCACDVTDRQQVAATLEHLRTLGPLRTIIHAAMVLDDALIENLTPERNRPVIDTKALGAEHLDLLTADDDLANFVLFSSVTTLFGNVGQANYVAANGYLEGVARRRRAAGKTALAVAFGPISDVGIIAKRSGLRDKLAHRLGEVGMTAAEALRQVDAYMVVDNGSVDAGSVVIANMDWSIISKLKVAKSSLFQPVMRAHGRHDASAGGSGDLKLLLADKTPSEAEAIVFGIVAEELATALQIPTTSILSSTTLKDVGLDSLMALELTMSLEKRTGLQVQLSGFSEPATIGMLVASILARVNNESTDENAPNPELGALLARHAAA